jgi:predicted transcriptional regulator
MENRSVGYFIIGLAAIMGFIVFLFNSALRNIVESSCTMVHGSSAAFCPMNQTINQQTYLSLAIIAVVAVIGLFLVFSKPKEKIVVRQIKDRVYKKEANLKGLTKEEIAVFKIIQENETMFQADLIDNANLGKAKVTRILDRLEGRGLVERKRRGMTNIVVLKND